MASGSNDPRAAFADDVAMLLRAAEAAGAMTVTHAEIGRSGESWIARPTGEGFSCGVELVDVSLGIRLGDEPLSWTWDEVLDPGDVEGQQQVFDDGLDLLATALWGASRLVVDRVGDRVTRLAVQFGGGKQWLTHATVQAPTSLAAKVTGLWARRQRQVLRNAIAPPRGVRISDVTPHPTAPWSGVLTAARVRDEAVAVPIDGVIDLHQYTPKQVEDVVLETIEQCRQRGIFELRIIHGKGIGNLRRTVHALLDRHPHVEGYRLGGHGGGSWGATIVDLKRP